MYFLRSKSNISREMAYITGRIRGQGSNSSHETRYARLLATLLQIENTSVASILFH